MIVRKAKQIVNGLTSILAGVIQIVDVFSPSKKVSEGLNAAAQWLQEVAKWL